jgi:hypothetical protein
MVCGKLFCVVFWQHPGFQEIFAPRSLPISWTPVESLSYNQIRKQIMKTAIIVLVSLITGAYFNQLVLNATAFTCKAGVDCIVGDG